MPRPDYQLVQLPNGAFSIHSVAEGETFHPVIGPVAEAQALYVNQLKLRERVAAEPGEFVIWDVGLGAAANVLTAVRATRDLKCNLRIISFDRTIEPLKFARQQTKALGYLEDYEDAIDELVATGQVDFERGEQKVRWQLRLADFPELIRSSAPFPAPQAILFD